MRRTRLTIILALLPAGFVASQLWLISQPLSPELALAAIQHHAKTTYGQGSEMYQDLATHSSTIEERISDGRVVHISGSCRMEISSGAFVYTSPSHRYTVYGMISRQGLLRRWTVTPHLIIYPDR